MLSIQECLENIKSAVFGRDVRQSIHDGIKRINDESKEDMKKKQDTIDIYTDKMDLLNDKYEEQIKNITLDSPSDYEIVDSRRTRENTVYATLKQRLDEDKNSIWVGKEATGIVTLEETPDRFGKLTICEGKNLMTNTNFSKGTEGWHGANGTTVGLVNQGGRTVIKVDTSTSSDQTGFVYQTINNVELDTMYTLEVDVYVETPKDAILVTFYLNNGWHKIDTKRFPVTTGWNKIYFTFKSDPTINNIITSIGGLKGEIIYAYHPCLKKGTEATGWTPAPEESPKIEQPVLDKNELFITPVLSGVDRDALTGPDIVKIEKDENLNFIIEPQYFHSLCNDILEDQGGSQGTLEFPVDLTVKVSYLSATTTKVNQIIGEPANLNTEDKTDIVSSINELQKGFVSINTDLEDAKGKLATTNSRLVNIEQDTGWIKIIGTDICYPYVSMPTSGSPLRYRKKHGMVYVYGNLKIDRAYTNGSSVQNESVDICTLPEGYRPDITIYHVNTATGALITRYYLNTNGLLKLEWVRKVSDGSIVQGTVDWASISISFPAASKAT